MKYRQIASGLFSAVFHIKASGYSLVKDLGCCMSLQCQAKQISDGKSFFLSLEWRISKEVLNKKAAVSQHLLVSLKSAVTPFTERYKLGLGQWLPEGVQAYWKGKKWPVWDDQIIQRASVKRWCVIMWTAGLNRRLE